MATVPNYEEFKSSSTTIFNKIKFHHTWTIHNFSAYIDVSDSKIVSPIFSDGTKSELKWRLEINSKGWNYSNIGSFLTLKVFLLSKIFNKLNALVQVSVLNEKLQNFHKQTNKVKFSESYMSHSFDRFISRKYLTCEGFNQLSYVPNNKLTILCEIEILKVESNENISIKPSTPNHLGRLLFENHDFSNVTFSVDEKELVALRAILVHRSPVFEAMFTHDMKEKKSSRIVIKDVDYEVLKEMLRFIYTNEIPNIKEMADRLLIAADKYGLDNLKQRCEEYMIQNLSVENAAQYFVVADQHNVNKLKIYANTFIKANVLEVGQTTGFKSVFNTHVLLFLPMMDELQ